MINKRVGLGNTGEILITTIIYKGYYKIWIIVNLLIADGALLQASQAKVVEEALYQKQTIFHNREFRR